MSKKIMFNEENTDPMPTNETPHPIKKPEVNNLFLGRPESDAANAKFPDWDIVPPNQFINPRIKIK